MTISVLSTEYILFPVLPTIGTETIDPTGNTVEVAIIDSGNPEEDDWQTAEWELDGSDPVLDDDGNYLAKLLVGPGDDALTLALGTYKLWIRITDTPEIPVRQVGPLYVR